jgi:hypothetical protein
MKNIKISCCLFAFLMLVQYSFAQNDFAVKYYRHLRYNHVSPHIPLKGIHEIDKHIAENTSHYVFKFDDHNRVVEIINNHYHSERRHPLASIGAYKTNISYSKTEETRTFFDKNDKRISNDREVYKEVFSLDKRGNKTQLKFYNLEDQPIESGWKIARYEWSQHKKWLVEKRYNLNNEPVNVSPYFAFGITGIKYGKSGNPQGHYNLNETYQITNNEIGVASYQDTYDAQGNHVRYTYHDQDNNLVKNQWGFAIGIKGYDENGNQILLSSFDQADSLIRERNIPNNISYAIAPNLPQKDSLEIKKIAVGYLVALQELDPALMERVMHKNLAKRTIGYDRAAKAETITETTYEQMLAFAVDWNKSGTKFPFNPNNQVTILDIYNRMATVKLVSDNWIEYLHLIKTNGQWEVINLLWLHKDANRYPRD